MIAVSGSLVRDNFDKYCDVAVDDFEAVFVTRGHKETVVILSESEYNNMLENLHVLGNPRSSERLIHSIDQVESGKGTVRELVEVGDE